MNNQKKNYAHVTTFQVKGKLALIHSLIQMGMNIEIDPTCQYACVGFDNIKDHNNFNDMLSHCKLQHE